MATRFLAFAAIAALALVLSAYGHGLAACAFSPLATFVVAVLSDGREYDR